jgi:hypothetical protein
MSFKGKSKTVFGGTKRMVLFLLFEFGNQPCCGCFVTIVSPHVGTCFKRVVNNTGNFLHFVKVLEMSIQTLHMTLQKMSIFKF